MMSVQLDTKMAVKHFSESTKRLLVLGYNATLTTAVEAPRQPKRHFDQIKVLSRPSVCLGDCIGDSLKDLGPGCPLLSAG